MEEGRRQGRMKERRKPRGNRSITRRRREERWEKEEC